MDVNSSAVLPPAAGIICLVDDDPSMLQALDRLLSSVGLQAQLFSEPLGFLSFVEIVADAHTGRRKHDFGFDLSSADGLRQCRAVHSSDQLVSDIAL